jgi:transcriptional regulator with XRE-family HTH domain
MMARQSDPPPARHEILGSKLRAAREGRGLTITHVAKAIDAKWQDVQEWERGVRAPRFEKGLLLARVLGMTLDDFFDDGYEPPHAAWARFIEAHGATLTPDEKLRLARFPWGDDEPTLEAYSVVLTGMRMARRRASPSS